MQKRTRIYGGLIESKLPLYKYYITGSGIDKKVSERLFLEIYMEHDTSSIETELKIALLLKDYDNTIKAGGV